MSDQESRRAGGRPATRLGWRARQKVRRSAVRVAARGEPSLDLNDRPVTTQERETFFEERNNSIGELQLALTKSLEKDLQRLISNNHRLPQLQAGLAAAREELVRLGSAPDGPGRDGPQADPRIVAARALRSRRQTIAQAQARLSALTKEIADLSAQNANLLATRDALSERYEAQKVAIHHSAVLKRALFDEHLTRHHRFRGLLELRLDRRIPPIPPELDVRLDGRMGAAIEADR
ncbi:hypothetical protein ACFPJ1_09250 [Kribbella qitaiheensis]|uniref:hypothetical protein n=1 Tax=Kribbella qitaiheensis TaxID=1544730 RepID=UPI003621D3BE